MQGQTPCYYFKFYLFVTGVGEEQHLPDLFKTLTETGLCTFSVGKRIRQLDPITSQTRIPKIVGTSQKIPDKDMMQIGFPARRFVAESPCHYVIVIDDLEYSRREQAELVFKRYRDALDEALKDKKHRAAVHFLVNMLEAYFFAHVEAMNEALNLDPPISDYMGNVETLRNPKRKLKTLFPAYNEVTHSGLILKRIDLAHILANEKACGWLRSCVYCIVNVLANYPDQAHFESLNLAGQYRLSQGKLSKLTGNQMH